MQTIGGYVLEQKLGQGGMGSVWRATNPRFPGQTFAVKVIVGDGGKPRPSAVERFKREMHALVVATEHPNVVRVFGGHFDGDTPYIVMELVNGTSLHGLAKGRGLDPERAARVVREIADAIEHAHGQGVIHRDLKPDNVLVEAGGRPRVCDFGLARIADEERLTRSGTVLGTPAYAAPEQLDGRAHLATARADVYALGAVLYFTLVGEAPFTGAGGEITRKVLLEPARPPSRASSGEHRIPPELDAICLKCLRKDENDRYPSARALKEELDRFLAGEEVEARAPSAFEHYLHLLRRRKRLALAVLLGLVIAAAAGALAARKIGGSAYDADIARLEAQCLAPGKGSEEIDLLLPRFEPYPELHARIERRRDELRALERWAAIERTPAPARSPGELAALVRTFASLKGSLLEHDRVFAIGDALLERRTLQLASGQAEDEVLLRATSELAGAASDKLAGTALLAYGTLAKGGLPTRPLGPGDPTRDHLKELVESVAPALEAARALPGRHGARAAWLLVDLLVLAGNRAAARAAAEAAKKGPDDPARPTLEAVLADERDPALSFVELAPRASGDRASALRLSRTLALGGLGALLDHPELEPDAAAVASVLATDPPGALRFARPRPRVDTRTPPELEQDRVEPPGGLTFMSGATDADLLAQMTERRAQNLPAYEARLASLLRQDPEDERLLYLAARSWRQSVASAAFLVLLARTRPVGTYELCMAFNEEDRKKTRLPTESGYYYFEKDWETPGKRGLAAVEDFDARLAKDAGTDSALAAVRLTHPEEVEQAVRALRALRRLEELEEADTGLDGAARSKLAFEALRELQGFASVAPAGALIFRARAFRAAYPGDLGEALATLELERALGAFAAVSIADDESARVAMVAASIAADGKVPIRGRHTFDRLWAFTVKRIHDCCVLEAASEKDRAKRVALLPEMLLDWRKHFHIHSFVGGLERKYVSEYDDKVATALSPTAADRDLLLRAADQKAVMDALEPRAPTR